MDYAAKVVRISLKNISCNMLLTTHLQQVRKYSALMQLDESGICGHTGILIGLNSTLKLVNFSVKLA